LNPNISGKTNQVCLGQNGFFWQTHELRESFQKQF